MLRSQRNLRKRQFRRQIFTIILSLLVFSGVACLGYKIITTMTSDEHPSYRHRELQFADVVNWFNQRGNQGKSTWVKDQMDPYEWWQKEMEYLLSASQSKPANRRITEIQISRNGKRGGTLQRHSVALNIQINTGQNYNCTCKKCKMNAFNNTGNLEYIYATKVPFENIDFFNDYKDIMHITVEIDQIEWDFSADIEKKIQFSGKTQGGSYVHVTLWKQSEPAPFFHLPQITKTLPPGQSGNKTGFTNNNKTSKVVKLQQQFLSVGTRRQLQSGEATTHRVYMLIQGPQLPVIPVMQIEEMVIVGKIFLR